MVGGIRHMPLSKSCLLSYEVINMERAKFWQENSAEKHRRSLEVLYPQLKTDSS